MAIVLANMLCLTLCILFWLEASEEQIFMQSCSPEHFYRLRALDWWERGQTGVSKRSGEEREAK